jgi:thymidylate synthase
MLNSTHPEAAFLDPLRDSLTTGDRRPTRNGNVRSKFARQMRFDLVNEGFPLVTTKNVPFDLVTAEQIWFIEGGLKPNAERGETYGRMSTHRLSEIAGREVKIWNGDADNFAKLGKAKFNGDCGRIYGAQWRDYSKYTQIESNANGQKRYVRTPIDQLKNLIEGLKSDPYSRYARVTAWNPAEIDDMALPACHAGFQCYVTPDVNDSVMRLSLHMEQRSCDMFLGVPFNIASYALLTHMLAQVCGYQVGELIITLLDYHVYEAHESQAREQLSRDPCMWTKLILNPDIRSIDGFKMSDIRLLNYQSHGVIRAPLLTANVK